MSLTLTTEECAQLAEDLNRQLPWIPDHLDPDITERLLDFRDRCEENSQPTDADLALQTMHSSC